MDVYARVWIPEKSSGAESRVGKLETGNAIKHSISRREKYNSENEVCKPIFYTNAIRTGSRSEPMKFWKRGIKKF